MGNQKLTHVGHLLKERRLRTTKMEIGISWILRKFYEQIFSTSKITHRTD